MSERTIGTVFYLFEENRKFAVGDDQMVDKLIDKFIKGNNTRNSGQFDNSEDSFGDVMGIRKDTNESTEARIKTYFHKKNSDIKGL